VNPTVLALAAAWGLLLATPLVRRARRTGTGERAATLGPAAVTPRRARRLTISGSTSVLRLPAVLARPLGEVRGRRAAWRLHRVVEHELPVTIDLLAVAVGAGCTPYLAVDVAASWAPPTLAAQLLGVSRACSLGRSFADALDELATRVPPLRALADALLASERFGAAVGDALLRLATEQRAVLRRRAESRARTVPVRLLFPLVFLVLPAFGLLTVVPALLAGFNRS
jgi:Type II secretion system (T2SS), protein F